MAGQFKDEYFHLANTHKHTRTPTHRRSRRRRRRQRRRPGTCKKSKGNRSEHLPGLDVSSQPQTQTRTHTHTHTHRCATPPALSSYFAISDYFFFSPVSSIHPLPCGRPSLHSQSLLKVSSPSFSLHSPCHSSRTVFLPHTSPAAPCTSVSCSRGHDTHAFGPTRSQYAAARTEGGSASKLYREDG